MHNAEIERDLINNGFTHKKILRLKKILNRPHEKEESILKLIYDLKNRFYSGCAGIGIIF